METKSEFISIVRGFPRCISSEKKYGCFLSKIYDFLSNEFSLKFQNLTWKFIPQSLFAGS